jgi:hypothetical protein
MIRRTLFSCCVALFACPAFAQETQDLGSLSLDLNRLKKWGTREYTYEASRPGYTGTGRIVLKTEITDDGVVLDDQVKITSREKESSLELTHQCKKDKFLSPKKIESKGKGDDEFRDFVATIDEGKATVRLDGKVQQREVPDGTITMWAFFRLVTLLPRQEGIRISFSHWLQSERVNLQKDFVVECLGRESLQWGDKNISCTKFRLTGSSIHPALYWVGDDDLLRQIVLDERKVIRLREDQPPDR